MWGVLRFDSRERREKQLLVCEHCRRTFEGRANAKHCSDRCRKAAFRARQREAVKVALAERTERDRRVLGLLEEAKLVLSGERQ